MNCLNCGKPITEGVNLCFHCSDQLDKDLESVLDSSSKTILSSDQLKITPEGVLILLGDKFLAYYELSPAELRAISWYIDQKWPESSE